MNRIFVFLSLCLTCMTASAQNTIRLDATVQHQRITGFGGFVCSPQFGYNHMSTTEIKKVWGESSTVGCNIMRLYIPIGRSAWSQSLQTAKTAKQLGLIVFASPWGQPAEWKTNGTSNAQNEDGTTGKLKRENWPDYAQYLEDYVQYLRDNGVELDAISIQNEPDWPARYAGCLWSASEIAEFVKLYGQQISCKVMAPETLAVSDSYADALNNQETLPCFDIYGGHQYGGIQTAYKKLAAKGKEIWMTEYLINWNEIENNTRNFDFSKDFFNFFSAINECMLGDFNAWVHYAAKRYYAMMGDGQRGTSNGSITKRGYVMAHFARFVTGMTRIDASFGDTGLEGSAYLSQSGDTAVVVVSNQQAQDISVKVDLPFYTLNGAVYSTTQTNNFAVTQTGLDSETCRPSAVIPARSVTTLLYIRSSDRQPSSMSGSTTRFDRIDDMKPTRSTFGANYKLSGKTKTFDHNNPLISSRTNATSGYVQLSDRFSQLVLQVKKVTSTMNYSSAKTTLIYVNGQGQAAVHDYGDLDLSRRENFSLVFDLSPQTLPDGCRGLISLTNNNWSSTLTITFGDVYLGSDYAATLSGAYVADDGYVLDFTEDAACTSLDFSAVTELPSVFPWLNGSNRVAYVAEGSPLTGVNVVNGSTCSQLALSATGGDFRPAKAFQAESATFTGPVNGLALLMLPFQVVIPEGAKVYTISDDLTFQQMRSIPAHTPMLVEGWGELTFNGIGEVDYATSPLTAVVRGSYVHSPLYAGDYLLACRDGQWGLERLTAPATLQPFGAYVSLASQEDFIPLDLTQTGIRNAVAESADNRWFNLFGQPVEYPSKGIFLKNGKKVILKGLKN